MFEIGCKTKHIDIIFPQETTDLMASVALQLKRRLQNPKWLVGDSKRADGVVDSPISNRPQSQHSCLVQIFFTKLHPPQNIRIDDFRLNECFKEPPLAILNKIGAKY